MPDFTRRGLILEMAMVVTLVLGFLIALTMCWDQKYENNFIKISYAVWFAVSAHIASYFYYIEIPTFAFFQLLFIFGFFLSNQESTLKSDDSVVGSVSCAEEEQDAKVNTVKAPPCDLTVIQSPLASKPIVCPPDTVQMLLHQVRWYTSDNTSDYYIYWVSVACVITLILQSGWIPYVLALLFLVYIIRHLCKSFGVTDFVHSKYCLFMDWISEWYFVRKNVLIPAPILCLNTMFSEVRSRLLSILKDSSDSAATVIVILALLFVVIFGSTFLVIQAYTEGMYMMKVGGSVINQTVVHNPELTQLLPEGLEQQLNSVLNNAYIYGRQAISKFVRNMLSEVSEEKALEVEDRVLDLWDRVYQAWMMSAIEKKTTIGPKVTSSAVYQTWDNFIDIVHRTPELVSMRAVTDWAQNNMVMLTSGLESVWELIRGNASLVLSAFLTVFTVVFTHSFAVLNFCISMIVFLTALFYLLSSSRQLYKPVELITAISPVFGKRLAFAMENAVNEVLTASFKLAVFYGMWTWLIHNLFQMNIVYIPSVLAAMLAVVPALGTYWACLPAVLDLWLAQGKKFHAITLAVCQFLPTLFVDATIYTEINEGHPYLTGLSVAGGLFCMGMEGAIIRPLILCCLYVVVIKSSAIM
ncbi:transmembrane protein 245 isoform X2 [Macrosteles quadrilineatus]|uniref:transmembrane protein 245 isoform X2 n=1 Tax=Macrosteles quadrilineatus TaxID=74068 RepID=UPI0023E224FB|nr:transmembrane protein 245 isoform X2 [Macrosteles quadrilineatus]